MQFFDTHAHIGLIYDDPIEQLRVIQQAKQAGVSRIISINNSLHDFGRVYKNLKALPGIYHAVGIAPSEVTNPGPDYISKIEDVESNVLNFEPKKALFVNPSYYFYEEIYS